MKISLELKFEQLLQFIQQLSLHEKKKLLEAVQQEVAQEEQQTELQALLLKGPTWSEEEYENFLNARKQLDKVGSDAIN
ncbi:MAG: hypothetical protein IPJ74_02300 [Saprospiraceae bacterium]|nr:hypothetical protein [Saprospiraceae bacterium]